MSSDAKYRVLMEAPSPLLDSDDGLGLGDEDRKGLFASSMQSYSTVAVKALGGGVRPRSSSSSFQRHFGDHHNPHNYNLEFLDIRVSVSVPRWMPAFATPGIPGETTHILRGVSGRVSTGESLAIIGASGSGKTTLLDQLVLSGSQRCSHSGSISINGRPMTRLFFRQRCAYVAQDDRLWGALTVEENLTFAGALYAPQETVDARVDRVDTVLHSTGLASCRSTRVGGPLLRGVSGGQRRRLSIAVELMNPRTAVLFLDEPTSGLDSKSAAEIMSLLRRLAQRMNLLIVASVHQPSTRTFLAFDRTLLLSRGRAAYFGPAADALTHFENLGYEPPPRMNPADFLLEISNPDFTSAVRVERLLRAWALVESARRRPRGSKAGDDDADEGDEHDIVESEGVGSAIRAMCKAMNATAVLSRRTWLSYARDPGAYIGRAVLYGLMSLVFGVIYIKNQRDQAHVLNYLFSIMWGIGTPSYMAIMIMPVFIAESATFEKEARNGMYGAFAYALAAAAVQLPFVLITSTLSVAPYYWLDDIHPAALPFLAFWLLQFSFLYTVESLCCLCASLIPHFIIALGVVCSVLSLNFVFNGLFISASSVPWALRWIDYISPHGYALKGLAKLAFSGTSFTGFEECVEQGTGACYGSDGDQVLSNVQVRVCYCTAVCVCVCVSVCVCVHKSIISHSLSRRDLAQT